MTDTEFMVHILAEICDYAKANEMDPDDTIRTICGNFIGMLKISSFRNWKGEDSCLTEWNNHTVACLLAELFDDTCACNYNGIDEWLPEKCEVIDACPHPVGVACWEQYLEHRAERKWRGEEE